MLVVLYKLRSAVAFCKNMSILFVIVFGIKYLGIRWFGQKLMRTSLNFCFVWIDRVFTEILVFDWDVI